MINHRFALSHPALVSAPSKNSFSSVSSPILACSDFTSTAGVAGVPPPGPKISEALASSCDFHVVIWLGWTSKCSASWAMVRSPLTAARATFALKAGEWFRRGRLLMVSPVHGDYRRYQAETPLIALSKFPRPALVRVSKCGGGICGVVVWLRTPIDPATGKPATDDKNPHPSLAKRPV